MPDASTLILRKRRLLAFRDWLKSGASPHPPQIATALSVTSNGCGIIPPHGIIVIFDERLIKLAALRVGGVDLSTPWAFPPSLGGVALTRALAA